MCTSMRSAVPCSDNFDLRGGQATELVRGDRVLEHRREPSVLGAHPTESDLCSQIRVTLHGGANRGAPHGHDTHPSLHRRVRITQV
jgi:hypothetical protein